MELLSVELERSLRTIRSLAKKTDNFAEVRASVKMDCISELVRLGYVERIDVHLIGSGSRTPVQHYSLTLLGRTYFLDRARDSRMRWAPVLVSAAIGSAGTLLGVIATLLLT